LWTLPAYAGGMEQAYWSSRLFSILIAGSLLADCSGGTAALPTAAATGPAAAAGVGGQARAGVAFRFKIPRKPRRGRGGRYLSQSTASIQITAFNTSGTKQLGQVSVNTLPGFGTCTPIVNTTFSCTVSMELPIGGVVFDVNAYDGPNDKGVILSALKNFPSTIVLGKANQVDMTLGGVPTVIDASFVNPNAFAHSDNLSGFHIGGVGPGAAQELLITCEDGDQNTIVGPGSPTIALQSNDSTDFSIAPVSGSNGLYKITPLHPTTIPATLTIQATPTGSAASPINTSLAMSADQILFVANGGSPNTIAAYAPWNTMPVLTIPATSGLANAWTLALDASGNLYVANFAATGSVEVFPPGSTTASRTITGVTAPAFGLAVDGSGDVFVTEYLTHDVKEFTPSGGSTPSRTLSASSSPTGINKPAGLALDASGNLYVSNNGGTIGVSVYAPGTSTTPIAVFNAGMTTPAQLTFDGAGNLYVANNGGNSVTQYKPPFSNSSTASNTYTSANTTTPFSIAIDSANNVWVGQASGGHIVEFTPAGAVSRTISGYTNAVYSIAADTFGDTFATDNGVSAVGMYSPSSGVNPAKTYTNAQGVDTPYFVLIWP
jgi:sugar lactone lactonase YvrE